MRVKRRQSKQSSAVWHLWRDGITQSALQQFIMCREQFRLKYSEGWTPVWSSMPIEFGTCFHHIMERVYGDLRPTDGKFSGGKLTQLIKSYEKTWKGWTRTDFDTLTIKAEYQENRELCLGMASIVAEAYFQRWPKDFSKEWLFTEKLVKQPYRLPEVSATIQLVGKLDGAYKDSQGAVWLFDTKTKGEIVEQDIADLLPTDFQMMFYLTLLELQTGECPKGVRYNIVRRPGLRRSVSEKIPDFLARVKADVAKRPDHYFLRFDMSIDPSEVAAFRQTQLDPALTELVLWTLGKVPHYINHQALKWGHVKSDMFYAITKGDYSDLYQRTKPYPELEE